MSYGWDRGRVKNNVRPALDPLFRSTGFCCGPRAIGSILAATLGDGAAGLSALKQCGGITVLQDPSDAAIGRVQTSRSQPYTRKRRRK
jgi:two-component system, chemotaxis family, protein-glutamate methylesterase/glutaminase